MDREQFQVRTKQIALRVIKVVEALPKRTTASVMSRLKPLMQEVDEILAMTVASIKTLRRRKS